MNCNHQECNAFNNWSEWLIPGASGTPQSHAALIRLFREQGHEVDRDVVLGGSSQGSDNRWQGMLAYYQCDAFVSWYLEGVHPMRKWLRDAWKERVEWLLMTNTQWGRDERARQAQLILLTVGWMASLGGAAAPPAPARTFEPGFVGRTRVPGPLGRSTITNPNSSEPVSIESSPRSSSRAPGPVGRNAPLNRVDAHAITEPAIRDTLPGIHPDLETPFPPQGQRAGQRIGHVHVARQPGNVVRPLTRTQAVDLVRDLAVCNQTFGRHELGREVYNSLWTHQMGQSGPPPPHGFLVMTPNGRLAFLHVHRTW